MKKVLKSVRAKSTILKELFGFLWENRLWWIIPFVVVVVLFGILIIFAQTSPVSPFIYALF